MKKGTVVSLKSLRIKELVLKNNCFVWLSVLFIAGMICGTFLCVKTKILYDFSLKYTAHFESVRKGAGFLNVLFNSFMSDLLVILAIFGLGTSMLGVVLVPLFSAFNGLLCGSVSAYLYSEYAVKGIAFSAVLIVPAAIIFIIAFLLAAREAVKFSLLIGKLSLPGHPAVNISADFKCYCGKYLVVCLVVIVSAVADAVLSCTFLEKLALH